MEYQKFDNQVAYGAGSQTSGARSPDVPSIADSVEVIHRARAALENLADQAQEIASRLSGPVPTPVSGEGKLSTSPSGLVDQLQASAAGLTDPISRIEYALSSIQRRVA